MRLLDRSIVAIATVFLFAGLCSQPAQSADDKAVIFDPAKLDVDPDYKIQGEYKGDVGDDPAGLQVIALGHHEFQAVAYVGGLPGDGWERGDVKYDAKGKTENGETKLSGDDGYAIIEGDTAKIYNTEGKHIGTMKKTVRKSTTMGAKPPKGAMVLFDGKSADKFEKGKIVLRDLLLADCTSKEKLGDHKLHLEFRTPYKPTGRGQGRGNSGVYIQGRYECQVLDSFGLSGENNECGGIYQIGKPKVNMCYPPMTWQTYDMDFTSAKYNSDGQKTENAQVTIKHNGFTIHDKLELPKQTPGKWNEEPGPQSLYLQGHGNPVVYRNIWVVKK